MKTLLLTTALFFFSQLIFAQSPVFEWAKSFGGNRDDIGVSVVTDSDGNAYTAGAYYGTVDFNPNSGSYILNSAGVSSNNPDAFIQKTDSNGNFVWAKSMGGKDGEAI